MTESAILIFAKAPQIGLVKTRLIPIIGEQKACALHSAMVVQSVELAVDSKSQDCEIQLWCAPDTHHDLFRILKRNYPINLHEQTTGNLGLRMYHALHEALIYHDQAVLIGTDCPTLAPNLITLAFQALKTNDVVIAPAEDGGYVLIGMTNAVNEVFTDINWGSSEVYVQTLRQLQHLGLVWKELPMQWDVDRPADLHKLIQLRDQYSLHPRLLSLITELDVNNDTYSQFNCHS